MTSVELDRGCSVEVVGHCVTYLHSEGIKRLRGNVTTLQRDGHLGN